MWSCFSQGQQSSTSSHIYVGIYDPIFVEKRYEDTPQKESIHKNTWLEGVFIAFPFLCF